MTCFCSTSLNITVSSNHPQILRRLRSIDSLRAASGKRVKISPCVGTAQGSEKQPSRVCPTYEPSPKHSEKKNINKPNQRTHAENIFFLFPPSFHPRKLTAPHSLILRFYAVRKFFSPPFSSLHAQEPRERAPGLKANGKPSGEG